MNMQFHSRALDPDMDLLVVAAFVLAGIEELPWWPFWVIVAISMINGFSRWLLAKEND